MKRLEMLLDDDDQRKVAMYLSVDTAKVIYEDGSVGFFQWVDSYTKSKGWGRMGWQRAEVAWPDLTVTLN